LGLLRTCSGRRTTALQRTALRAACKVQDDMGGEGLWTAEIEVT